MVSAGRRPDSRRTRSLGQNFLVDRNILDVIERLACLEGSDVVLEIGGGPGVLSERLAARVRHLHVVEVDPRLEERLRAAVAPYGAAVSVHIADALGLDLAALSPRPTKLVANLPYAVAASVILRTIEELPGVGFWLAMVQREVGERLAASAGSPAYGVPSVLAQLSCSVRVERAIPRTVFRPVPNVDSVLVSLRRFGPAAEPRVRELVHRAFAHRRKTLAGSLTLAAGAAPGVREHAREALVAIGHPADARAERLAPEEFRELSARLAS